MKKLASLSIFCIIWCFADGQTYLPVLENGKPKIFDWPVMMTRVYFNIADSTYDYTLFREPGGTFYFAQGFDQIDDSLSLGLVMSPMNGKHKRRNTLEVKSYTPSYHWTTNEIHTASRFKPFNIELGRSITTNDSEITLAPYVIELAYTAVQDSLHLQDISKLPVNDVMRLTRIDDHFFGLGPIRIEFYEIVLDDPSDPKIRYIEAKIDSSMKCRITLELDFRLNKRDSKAFFESLRSVENEKFTFTTKADLNEPFLIEIRRGEKYTVLERSSGINPDRDFRTEHSNLFWCVENSRKRFQRKQVK